MRGANVSPKQRGKTWVADETGKAASFHLRPDNFKFFRLFQDSSFIYPVCCNDISFRNLSGTFNTYGFWDIRSHSASQTRPTMIIIMPRTKIVLLQFKDIMVMPMLPTNMPKQLNRAAADPVSSLCCSSTKLAQGVRTQLAQMVAGKSAMVSIQG
jgi:hypothetical protein